MKLCSALCVVALAGTIASAGNKVLSLASGGYVEIPDNPSQRPADKLTIEFWMNISAASGDNARPVSKRPGSAGSYSVNIQNGATTTEAEYFNCANTDNVSVQSDEWIHLAYVYDSAGVTRIYRNGALSLEETGTPCPLAQTGDPIRFGLTPGYPITQFVGRIDNIRLWSEARTGSQIASMAARQLTSAEAASYPTLIGSWTFEDGDASDATGVNSGVLVNGASVVEDSFLQTTYAQFKSPSDTIRIQGNTVFNRGDFTYEMHVWFDPGSYGHLISEQRDGYEDKILVLGDERYQVSACYATTDGADVGTLADLQPGRWMHVAYVKNGGERVLYVDGVAARQLPPAIGCYGDSPDSWMSLGMFRYGAGLSATGPYPSFQGKLDWIRVSTTARYTDTFLPPLESDIVSDTQTQLLLRFNEPAGTATLIDESPNHLICDVGVPVAPGVDATSPLLGQADAGCTSATLVLGPSSAALLPNQTATFTVSAAGTGLTYKWQKDSADLNEGGRFAGTTTNSLTIADVQSADQGDYRCVVSGACGTAVSLPASLSCKPIITAQPPTHAPQKRTLQLSVGVPDSAPYTYRWQRNGVGLFNTPGTYSGTTTRTLRILSPDFFLGGAYTCELTDVCGITLSAASKVCLADFNADELIDDADFVDFARAYDTLTCDDSAMPSGCPADFNNDTIVDDVDFVLFAVAYGELLCP